MCGLKPVSLLLLSVAFSARAEIVVQTPRLHQLTQEIMVPNGCKETVRFLPLHASKEHLLKARLVVTEPHWGSFDGGNVVTLAFERLSDWQSSVQTFANLLGCQKKIRLPDIPFVFSPARTKVLIEVGSAPLVIAGNMSFLSDALSVLGFEVVGCERAYCLTHPEQILRLKPDSVLILGQYQLSARVRFWQSLGLKVESTDDSRLLQPTLSWPIAVKALATRLRPKPLFPFL